MSDRFYQQMRDTTGWAPGMPEFMRNNNKYRRRRKMAWTDESKEQAIEMYQDAEPTPETSMEIVKDIAEELGESPNGVRMILTKAGVYVRKTPAAKSSGGSTGGGRVSVADAQDKLTSVLGDAGQEVDAAIISKLTGKAAVYFANVIESLNK
jgi:transposase-like protein